MTKEIQRGGPRLKTRPDDARGGSRDGAGRKGYTLTCFLGDHTFIFDVGRKAEVEAVKRFAEMIGYTVTVEKSTKGIIL